MKERMVLYYLKYKILKDSASRAQCLTAFGHMTEDDDRKDAGDDIRIVGRPGSHEDCVCGLVAIRERRVLDKDG